MSEERKSKIPPKVRIVDPLLGECHITVDSDQYTLIRGSHPLGYFGSLGSCLKKMAREKIIAEVNGGQITVVEYIKRYEDLLDEFRKLIDER